MDKIKISGLNKVSGIVNISGSKNASLPIIAASLLTDEKVTLKNIPNLTDVNILLEILEGFGAKTTVNYEDNGTLVIDNTNITNFSANAELVAKMRASILVLGPLLAKYKTAKVPLPGGCALGERAIDLHISSLQKMGASYSLSHGCIEMESSGLKGAEIEFPLVSVGATEAAIMAACLAEGETKLINAAKEPEIVDLANFLIALGADISGQGTSIVTIKGKKKLGSTTYSVISDRIEAMSYICLGVANNTELTVNNVELEDLEYFLRYVEKAGVKYKAEGNSVTVFPHSGLKAIDITTKPYPYFPTDAQPLWMAAMSVADGKSLVHETIFENRFTHVPEFRKFGAELEILNNHNCMIKGVEDLESANAKATNLRAGFALLILASIAKGETEITGVHHIFRGYENLIEKLQGCGVKAEFIKAS